MMDRKVKYYLFTLLLTLGGQQVMAATDLFISEYIEGSSFNKAVELFNDTGATVDLSTYSLQYYFNGSASPGLTINLSGTVVNGDVYVVARSKANAAILALADLTSTSSWYNGDDAVVLVNNGTDIDVIGQIGFDPGTQWGSGVASTKDNTLRRKSTISAGDPIGSDAFDPSIEWDGFAQDDSTDLGMHTGGGGGEPPPPPPPPPSGLCGDPASFIHDIQGSGLSSPQIGTIHSIEGVVVGDFQNTSTELDGFFVQEEDLDADLDANTSEGIFVFDNGFGVDVNVGDVVRVTGTVDEFFELTELKTITEINLCSTGASVTAAAMTLPFASATALEAYEGMAVNFAQTLTVTENWDLGRFGEVVLSSGGRLSIPTNIAAPGMLANAQQAANNLNRIVVDDGSTLQNPDPIKYPSPGLSALNTLRSGDTVTGLACVLSFSFGEYVAEPTSTPAFVAANARPAAPVLPGNGSLRIASFNVLNYFNGDGEGQGFPTARGADTASEFSRQRDKIIDAIIDMDAAVIGLMEIENDGYDEVSSIQDLVNGLNAAAPVGDTYALVDAGGGQLGSDAIAVGFIYRSDLVSTLGGAATTTDFPFDTRNRQPLAQTFQETASGGKVTLVVNHFKSKGSCPTDGSLNEDQGDGQGCWNDLRTRASNTLVTWLAGDPTASGDPDVLIMGDLNAYAKEDPISALKSQGYTDMVDSLAGVGAYSFIFFGQSGYLDHALANASLAAKVTGVNVWHINADEPRTLDYNEEFKSAGQISSLYNVDAYRSSDHDPVVIELNP